MTARPPIVERFPRPSVMGVLNVTPDSFSDGGLHLAPAAATAAARRMLEAGAAIVDIGGESTRPGAEGVSADEELRRVEPVLEALAGEPVSIDTSKAAVARRALELGAELVNDVTALRADPLLAGVVADAGAYVCLMHMRGEPRTMQEDPAYDDVVSEVKAFLEARLAFAVSEGVREDRVCLDPGIGFGKSVEHNLELVRRLDELVELGRPLVVGFSRKRTLGRILGDAAATRGTAAASVGAAVAAFDRGATVLRVHDVREHVEALLVAGGGGMRIELHGLELHGHHGVTEAEQDAGQLFVYDVELEVGERGANDRIEDAVDYREVAAAVREVAEVRHHLLEALAAAIADTLVERFPVERVRVRVRKPEVRPAGIELEFAAVTAERP